MKTIYRFIICSFMLILFAGCVKDEALLENSPYDIVARMEYGADTRTSLSGLQEDGLYYPLWSEGDEIAMYVDGDVSPSKFELVSGTGKTEATFAGTREGASCYAVYPFSAAGKQQDGTISLVLPGTQQYVAGSFGPDSYPMIASGNKNEGLDFKNLCAVMKISITGDATIRSITLQAKDKGIYLSGAATVNGNYDSYPQLQMLEGGSKSVRLDCKGTELAKDSVTDFHFVIPAQSYKGGFDVIIDAYTDTIVKSVVSDLEFKRSQIRHLKGMELNFEMDEHQKQLAKEKAALIAIYQALDGDNWTNNENWCSDKPVNEWYGINTNDMGYVCDINLWENNLVGEMPLELCSLTKVENLSLGKNMISGTIPEDIGCLSQLKRLYLIDNKLNGQIPQSIGQLKNLKSLYIGDNNLEGLIPKSIGELKNLKSLHIGDNNLEGNIPPEIGNLSELEEIFAHGNMFTGSIPDELCQLTNLNTIFIRSTLLSGPIPANIGNLKNLESLNLCQNNLSGKVPESIIALDNLKELYLVENNLEIDLPQSTFLDTHWGQMLPDNFYDLKKLHINFNSFNMLDLNGNRIDSKTIFSSNKYTLMYHYSINRMYEDADDINRLKQLYSDFSEEGFEIISYINGEYNGTNVPKLEDVEMLASKNEIPWPNIFMTYNNCMDVKYAFYPYIAPTFTIVDSTGRVVFFDYAKFDTDLKPVLNSVAGFVELKFNKNIYTSTDYTQDGTTVQMQKATEGNGINIVLMGDGYSDRQIADGSYKADMEYVYSNLFTKEPYKSYKHLFDVSYVNVVSATEGFEYGNTALSCGFGNGTYVYGNDNAVFKYAQKVVDASAIDETLMIVVMNSNNYAGTCFMYYPNSSGTDYGKGPAVAYFPKGESSEVFAQLLHHEANGHGFAKLADEYAYDYMGTIPSEEVESTKNQQSLYGWWKNIDFTNDPAQVRWKKFLEDSRYANEGLGVFEGGDTYWSGVWRPTENSIMRHNQGEFNAPSREAIYYRIHKLAYGEEWQYDYEKFVEYDAVNYNAQAAPTTKVSPLRPKQQLHPPVVVKKSWREAGN